MGRPISLHAAIASLPDLTVAPTRAAVTCSTLQPVHGDDRAYSEALALCARCPS